MTKKKSKKTSPKLKIKTTKFQVKILESRELDDLFEKVNSLQNRLFMNLHVDTVLRAAGEIFSFQNFDSLDLELGNPELKILEWFNKKKTVFKVSEIFVAATFQKIKKILSDELKDLEEDAKRKERNRSEDLQDEIKSLEEKLVQKKNDLKNLKK